MSSQVIMDKHAVSCDLVMVVFFPLSGQTQLSGSHRLYRVTLSIHLCSIPDTPCFFSSSDSVFMFSNYQYMEIFMHEACLTAYLHGVCAIVERVEDLGGRLYLYVSGSTPKGILSLQQKRKNTWKYNNLLMKLGCTA